MLAVDLAGAVLVGGILVLCVTTTITALTLPSFNPTWRRRPRSDHGLLALSYRSTVADPPLPTLALPAAPGHRVDSPDDRFEDGDIDAAWALIERLLEHDPDRLVEVLTRWISSAEPAEDLDATNGDARRPS